MQKVAVTGNIGSGKSTVTRIFETLGVPVFHADAEAKKLYLEKEIIEEVKKHFGPGVFNENNILLKEKLAQIIFNDEKALQVINSIIHPATLKKYQTWLVKNQDKAYTIHESAILFENKLESHFDKTITVYAPERMRLQRVVKRDGIPEKVVRERMENQLHDELKNEKADFVIYNDDSVFLIEQVLKIDKKLKEI